MPGPEEARVEHAAARSLLPCPHEVADALVWAGGHVEVAARELWVDAATLEAWLDQRHLDPEDVAVVDDRLREEGIGA